MNTRTSSVARTTSTSSTSPPNPLWVSGRAPSWREEGQRDEVWLPLAEAAVLVQEPRLKAILLRLNLTVAGKRPSRSDRPILQGR